MGVTFELYQVLKVVKKKEVSLEDRANEFDLLTTHLDYKSYRGYKRYEKRLIDAFNFNLSSDSLIVSSMLEGMCYPRKRFFKKKFHVLWCVTWKQIEQVFKIYFNLKKDYNQEFYKIIKNNWKECSGMFLKIMW